LEEATFLARCGIHRPSGGLTQRRGVVSSSRLRPPYHPVDVFPFLDLINLIRPVLRFSPAYSAPERSPECI
jgi:hypothetical protein